MNRDLSTLYRAVGILPQNGDSTAIEAYRQTVIETIRETLRVVSQGGYEHDTLVGFPAFTAESRKWKKTYSEIVSMMGRAQLYEWKIQFDFWVVTLPIATFTKLCLFGFPEPAKESLRAA